MGCMAKRGRLSFQYPIERRIYGRDVERNVSSVADGAQKDDGRIGFFFAFSNVSQYLLSEYEDLLTKKDRVFLEMLSSYKRNIITRLKLIFDKDFRRDTLKGTAILKTGVLLGWL